jgi:hypothetical protein
VTGQHGRRGSVRRDHGPRDPARAPDRGAPHGEGTWRASAEVEDIETRGLAPGPPGSGMPLGRQGMVAAAALVALLLLGFGALGGRVAPDASPGASVAAVDGTSGVTAASTPGPTATPKPTPQVTPWTACAPLSDDVPTLYLEVDGRRTELETNVVWQEDPSNPPPSRGGRAQAMVVVPSDVHTELWIEDGACANAWSITIDGLDAGTIVNAALDPAVAAQNRFELSLPPFAGREVVLRARLVFPRLLLDTVQAIRVEPYADPVARVAADGLVQPVEGCDVVVTLGNGYEADQGCTDDLPYPPDDVLVVDAGTRISFELLGWTLMGATTTCGHLSGLAFVAEPEPGCYAELEVDPDGASAGFTPAFEGRWTLAISACALETAQLANRVCGTWFAEVLVEV